MMIKNEVYEDEPFLKDASVVLQGSSWGRKTVGGKAGRPVYIGSWKARIHREGTPTGRLKIQSF